MIINAEDIILGRLASFVAKRAMEGENVKIINAEKAVIIGDKGDILSRYERKRKMGHPYKGPFFSRTPERLVRRTIRGMLPYKQEKGREAFKNIKCYIGVPENLKDNQVEIKNGMLGEHHMKFMYIKDLVRLLGHN